MYKDPYIVEIYKIMCVFSAAIKAEELEQFRYDIQSVHPVEIKVVSEDEARELFDLKKSICVGKENVVQKGMKSIKATVIDFCITDIPAICHQAKKMNIPSLLYLHDANREHSMGDIPYAITELAGADYQYLCEIYKRFFYIPWTILETERCVLREMTEDDLDALYEVYKDPSMSLYTENLYEDHEKERQYIHDYIENVYRLCGLGVWLIILKENGKIIGRAGLSWRDEYETPEIGYVIAKEYQRQNYAYEVCGGILKYCKDLDFDIIRVIYQKENVASHALCKKLGFQVVREYESEGNSMIDAVLSI